MSRIVVGVDTGNRCIKTVSQVMVAGIRVSDTYISLFRDSDTIYYNGMYYTLTNDRKAHKRDKTIDDEYFVLSLFGVAKELTARGIDFLNGETTHVVLAVGLPPAHFSKQKDSFRDYFMRGEVSFTYNGNPAKLYIDNVHVLIQGYAAIYNRYNEIRKLDEAYIVDIGGFTTDVIEVQNGKTNANVCFSEDAGMIHLYNRIKDELNIKFDGVPKEHQIEKLLSDPEYQLEDGMKEVAIATAEEFVNDLIGKLREKGVDLRLSTGIFVGGGALRLGDCIKKSSFVKNPIFIDDIRANASGYEAIIRYKYAKNK